MSNQSLFLANLIDLGPKKVFEEHLHYWHQWKAEKLVYLAQNTVETVGDESHRFLQNLKHHFPDTFAAIANSLPRTLPAPTTKTRLIQLCQDCIQWWYIHRMVQQEKVNKCRAEYKEKIGKAIHQRNFNNMYGNPQCAAIAVAAAEGTREMLLSGTQIRKVQTTETGIQMEAAHLTALQDSQSRVMLDTGDIHIVQTVLEPQMVRGPLAEPQPPPLTPAPYIPQNAPQSPEQAAETQPISEMSTQAEVHAKATSSQSVSGQDDNDSDTVTFDVTEMLKEWSTGEFPLEVDTPPRG